MFNYYNRIIPVLLLKGEGLYKGKKFKSHRYIGDPINVIKILNEKEVDELVFFDIEANLKSIDPNLEKLKEITSECFMPLSFGGGVTSVELIREILSLGVEKVIINSEAVRNPRFVKKSVEYFGSSTITACVDYKSDIFGRNRVYINSGNEKTKYNPMDWILKLESMGVGEIIVNSIDRDGTKSGYDYEFFDKVHKISKIPLIISGGLNGKLDYQNCNTKGIKNLAGGAQFVFQGKHDAVLITYNKI